MLNISLNLLHVKYSIRHVIQFVKDVKNWIGYGKLTKYATVNHIFKNYSTYRIINVRLVGYI